MLTLLYTTEKKQTTCPEEQRLGALSLFSMVAKGPVSLSSSFGQI